MDRNRRIRANRAGIRAPIAHKNGTQELNAELSRILNQAVEHVVKQQPRQSPQLPPGEYPAKTTCVGISRYQGELTVSVEVLVDDRYGTEMMHLRRQALADFAAKVGWLIPVTFENAGLFAQHAFERPFKIQVVDIVCNCGCGKKVSGLSWEREAAAVPS